MEPLELPLFKLGGDAGGEHALRRQGRAEEVRGLVEWNRANRDGLDVAYSLAAYAASSDTAESTLRGKHAWIFFTNGNEGTALDKLVNVSLRRSLNGVYMMNFCNSSKLLANSKSGSGRTTTWRRHSPGPSSSWARRRPASARVTTTTSRSRRARSRDQTSDSGFRVIVQVGQVDDWRQADAVVGRRDEPSNERDDAVQARAVVAEPLNRQQGASLE